MLLFKRSPLRSDTVLLSTVCRHHSPIIKYQVTASERPEKDTNVSRQIDDTRNRTGGISGGHSAKIAAVEFRRIPSSSSVIVICHFVLWRDELTLFL